MTRASLHRVAWPEGMFLLPHHLQQLDAGAERRLAEHVGLLDPFHWGVCELEIDASALAAGQVSIVRLVAVLRDGTLLRCPDAGPIETRTLDPSVEEIGVYAGIRRELPGETAAVEEDRRDRHARYWIREVEVEDQGRANERAPVAFLVPNVRVFLSGEEAELESYEVLKVAEIEATGVSGQPYRVRRSYAPPLVRLEAFAALRDEVEGAVHQMAGKLRGLTASPRGLGQADGVRLLLVYTLGRMVPVLEQWLATGHTPPFQAYTALVETAAGLCALAGESVELPAYDHEDPYRCFRSVIAAIAAGLERELRERTTEVRLRYSATEGVYTVRDLARELTDLGNGFFLAIRTDRPRAELAALVTQEARAGALSQLPFFTAHAVRALTLDHLPAPPLELPPRPGFELFSIDPRSHATWKRVVEEGALGLRLTSLEDADVRLLVLRPEA